ncbi:MAG TPA: GNAT family protein [Solirubrobacteraceae bacterium]|nr:GNAT family protein [Solirubrobacteraceae bacterium]
MNEQPLGVPLDWTPPSPPRPTTLTGRHVTLRPLAAADDAADLYAVSHPPDGDPRIWTYLFDGPYPDRAAMQRALLVAERSEDPLSFTVVPAASGRPAGIASYLRITPGHGTIEIGNIWFAGALQRTVAATEVIYLLARHAFDELGYRRLEWKCNALNAPSRRAALRFGFQFEGVFEQHMVVKGRNRDTAWYAITDRRWPGIREGFEAWLDPRNFDPDGRQRLPLRELTCQSKQ